jgi:hypothetical protein
MSPQLAIEEVARLSADSMRREAQSSAYLRAAIEAAAKEHGLLAALLAELLRAPADEHILKVFRNWWNRHVTTYPEKNPENIGH